MNKIIVNRHSCRFFENKDIDIDVINKILKAASLAPSVHNIQPWRFRLVDSKETIFDLSKVMKRNTWIKDVNIVIAVYGVKSNANDMKITLSIGACIENMLLEAESLGVGTCWIGECIENEDEINLILENDNDKYKLYSLVAVGYENKRIKKLSQKTQKKGISQILV